MNILSMLVRLQNALGCNDLIDQIILSPRKLLSQTDTAQEINLVVGYNSSPKSQTALDLTLWIAHQTRLVTRSQVTVQVVYVVDSVRDSRLSSTSFFETLRNIRTQTPDYAQELSLQGAESSSYGQSVMQRGVSTLGEPNIATHQADLFEQADRILWQARCLANEWRGSLKTHLRFGPVAHELRQVVEAEVATLLWLGCDSSTDSIVQGLGADCPCPILGIPPALHAERYLD